jgi:hypothetical protein
MKIEYPDLKPGLIYWTVDHEAMLVLVAIGPDDGTWQCIRCGLTREGDMEGGNVRSVESCDIVGCDSPGTILSLVRLKETRKPEDATIREQIIGHMEGVREAIDALDQKWWELRDAVKDL